MCIALAGPTNTLLPQHMATVVMGQNKVMGNGCPLGMPGRHLWNMWTSSREGRNRCASPFVQNWGERHALWVHHAPMSPPVIKMREVLTYASQPFQQFCKLMGWSLTLLWKKASDVLKSRDLIAMPQMLHTMSNMSKNHEQHRADPFWTEIDVKEMFPKIPRVDIQAI